MKLLLVLALTLLQFSLFATNNTDSLKESLSKLDGEAKAYALLDLAQRVSSTDSSLSFNYINEAHTIARQQNVPIISARAYFTKGDIYFSDLDYYAAIDEYMLAIDYFVQADSIREVGEVYNSIGLSYYYLGTFDIALEYLLKAVSSFEEVKNEIGCSRIYINIGMVYNRLGDYNSVIEYYKKAADLSDKLDEQERKANAFNGLGVGYYNAGEIETSKAYYRKALQIYRSLNTEFRTAVTINNLANIYIDEKDSVEVGLGYYEEAYEIFDKLDELRSKVFVMDGIGCAYRELGQYNKALKMLKQGVQIAKDNGLGNYILNLFYKDISSVYEKQGKIGEAFESFKMHKQYQDSMRQEQLLAQATAIEKKYEISKHEAMIAQLSVEKELAMVQIQKDKAFRNLGIFAILFLLVVVTYVSFGNYNRKKINKILTEKNIQIEAQRNELEQLNASKNKFFSLVAHDLKNPLHTVLGFSYLLHHEFERFDDQARRKYARDIYNSTNNIFRLLQNLLDWSRSQTGRLKYEPVVFELSAMQEKICNFLSPYAQQKNIELQYEVPGDIYVYATPMMIETILRNLASNAIKFTMPGGVVAIGFKFYEDVVAVCVKDTGIGMNEEELDQLFSIESKTRKKGTNNEDGSGLGLILCKEFVKLNYGKIWAESEEGKGSKFCFTVPLARTGE